MSNAKSTFSAICGVILLFTHFTRAEVEITEGDLRKAVENPNCGFDRVLKPGTQVTIESPNFPEKYDNNLECVWHIDTLVHVDLEINVSSVYIPSGCGGCDFLILRNGPNETSRLIEMYTWNSGPKSFASDSGSLYIRFSTNEMLTEKGFQINITAGASDVTFPGDDTTPHLPDPSTPNEPSIPPVTSTARPNSTWPTRTTIGPVVGPGIVINNNNNMIFNFFDLSKLAAWLSQVQSQAKDSGSNITIPGNIL